MENIEYYTIKYGFLNIESIIENINFIIKHRFINKISYSLNYKEGRLIGFNLTNIGHICEYGSKEGGYFFYIDRDKKEIKYYLDKSKTNFLAIYFLSALSYLSNPSVGLYYCDVEYMESTFFMAFNFLARQLITNFYPDFYLLRANPSVDILVAYQKIESYMKNKYIYNNKNFSIENPYLNKLNLILAFPTKKNERNGSPNNPYYSYIKKEIESLDNLDKINLPDLFYQNPLHNAILHNNYYGVKLLLDNGAKVDHFTKNLIDEIYGENYSSVVTQSFINLTHNLSSINLAIDSNADIDILELLIEHGANVNCEDTFEQDSLDKIVNKLLFNTTMSNENINILIKIILPHYQNYKKIEKLLKLQYLEHNKVASVLLKTNFELKKMSHTLINKDKESVIFKL